MLVTNLVTQCCGMESYSSGSVQPSQFSGVRIVASFSLSTSKRCLYLHWHLGLVPRSWDVGWTLAAESHLEISALPTMMANPVFPVGKMMFAICRKGLGRFFMGATHILNLTFCSTHKFIFLAMWCNLNGNKQTFKKKIYCQVPPQ